MYRFVYCPESMNVEFAYTLAAEYQLPIQHGDSERTINHKFDRNKISVLSLPEYRGFSYPEIICSEHENITCVYLDEWEDISKYSFAIKEKLEGKEEKSWSVPNVKLDKHRTSFCLSITRASNYILEAIIDGVVVSSIDVKIIKEKENFTND